MSFCLLSVFLSFPSSVDYLYDFNLSDTSAPPTPYLPVGFTYLPTDICPEKLPTMSVFLFTSHYTLSCNILAPCGIYLCY